LLRFLRIYIGRTQVLEEILATPEVRVLVYGLETKYQNNAIKNSRSSEVK
jgi:hypothetical protein